MASKGRCEWILWDSRGWRAAQRPPSLGYARLLLVLLGAFVVSVVDAGVTSKAAITTGKMASPGVISLTFDPCPDVDTQMIMDVLKNYNVPATFFLRGDRLMLDPEAMTATVHQMLEEGHFVGSMSMSERDLTQLNNREALSLIDGMEEHMKQLMGARPHLFLPPAAALNDRLLDYLGAKKYSVVLPAVDLGDKPFSVSTSFWKQATNKLPPLNQQVADRSARAVPSGVVRIPVNSITSSMLGQLLEYLISGGYTLVPLPALMVSAEKKSLRESYGCGFHSTDALGHGGVASAPLLDRMCEQLHPNYEWSEEWRPQEGAWLKEKALQEEEERERHLHEDDVEAHERAEFLYELLKEQLRNEVELRQQAQKQALEEVQQLGKVLSKFRTEVKELGNGLQAFKGELQERVTVERLDRELKEVKADVMSLLNSVLDKLEEVTKRSTSPSVVAGTGTPLLQQQQFEAWVREEQRRKEEADRKEQERMGQLREEQALLRTRLASAEDTLRGYGKAATFTVALAVLLCVVLLLRRGCCSGGLFFRPHKTEKHSV